MDGPTPCIVYEYKSLGCVQQHLESSNGVTLGWRRRLCILLDLATALDYLHTAVEPAIIHRDIKSANVL